jgi:hypothetical protein
MNVIVVFWVDSDNLMDVILRDESRTVKDQITEYAEVIGDNPDNYIGVQRLVIEQ